MIEEVIADARIRMEKAMEALQRELTAVRTGRAAPSLVERVTVEQYGTEMPLNQLANIAAPEARMITVTPWDKGLAHAIEKAIRDSDLGLNPATAGNVIRVPLPALNEERRRDLVKIVHKRAEEGRIAVRHARTHGREGVKKLEKVPEDDKKHAEKDLQKLHDDYIHKIDEMLKAKEAEIMEV